MPHARPESSFEAAARHLFRHIGDVEELRRNPLVVSFFVRGAKRQSRAILAEIHARILTEAETICTKLDAQGSRMCARRRQAIVAALCSGESAHDTAQRIGISMTHYYRERQAICTSVAQALAQEGSDGAARFQVADPLRLLFARAESLMDRGCAFKAVGILEEAGAERTRRPAQTAISLELALALVEVGREDRAVELLEQSRACAEPPTEDRCEWLDRRRALTQARMEIHVHDNADSGRALEKLARRSISDRRADDVSLDTLLACGEWHWQSGRFRQARTMLHHARTLERQLPHVSALQQISLMLLTGDSMQDCVNTYTLQHHWFQEALELSASNGSLLKTVRAMQGLMSCCVSTGRDDDVYAYAKECIAIAQRTDWTLTLVYAALNTIASVLRTCHWRAVDPLLFEVEKLLRPGTFLWAELKHLQGSFFARLGRYDRAHGPLLEAYKVARNVGNRQFEAVLVRDLAVALHRIGSAADSIDLLRQAIELAESNGTAYSLWTTYEVAAQLLADRRLLRLARQARAAMLACRNALIESIEGQPDKVAQKTRLQQSRRTSLTRPRLSLTAPP